MPPKTLGKTIRTLRESRDLTQIDLAERIGVTQGYIAQLENGDRKNPTLRKLKRLSKVLKVPLVELIE